MARREFSCVDDPRGGHRERGYSIRNHSCRPGGSPRGDGSAAARRRILVVAACPFPAARGTPIRIYHLSEALARRGHDVHVAAYHLSVTNPSCSFEIHRCAEVPWYGRTAAGPSWGKLWVDWKLAGTVRTLLETQAFDVIHAHHYEGLLAALAARDRSRNGSIPVVFDAHTLLESELPTYGLGLPQMFKRSAGGRLDRILPGRADFVVGVSDSIRDRLAEIGAVEPRRLALVPNGVELEYFTPETPSSRIDGRLVLVFAGNLSAYQDLDVMLHAFAIVREQRQDVLLKIVTDDDFGTFDPLISELGVGEDIQTVPGDFASLPGHLQEADIALNPRRVCDGVPQKLLNYMAAGRPIVSFRGSARHLRHLESGYIVDGNDATSFAEGILTVCKDEALARSMGEQARAIVAAELSWEGAAEQLEEIYSGLLDRRRV